MKSPVPAYPPAIAALLARAAQLLRAGRPDAALAPLREAAGLRPTDAAIQHDLGVACLECGLTADAITALHHAIESRPGFADAHLRLGIALEAAGRLDAALSAYRRAADRDPKLADARFRAGDLLDSLGRTEDAITAYRRAAAAAPKTTLARIATAKALRAQNRDNEAEKILRQALAVEPGNAAALDLLGHTLADLGRFEEARAHLLQAIGHAPLRAGSYYDAVRCRPVTAQDGHLIAQMRAAATLPRLEPAQRARVHLALGKAFDDLGEYQEAMHQFDAAAALRDAAAPFDLAAFEARVDRLIAGFPPALFAGAPTPAAAGAPSPIFILGLPRSGTTLVEQILSAHPAITAGGELSFWNEHGRHWDKADLPPPATLRQATGDYLRQLRAIAPNAAHVTDKMPLNIQWAGLIHLAMPYATILHCHRTPIDTALSIHQTHFNPRLLFPTGGAALVGYVRATGRLAAHWRHAIPPQRFVDVSYETLAAAPEAAIRHLIAACGLEWSDACLRPELNARAVKTASKWQARQPIYANAVGRWRKYEPWLGDLRALV